jgi:hypothetical protein
MVYFHFIPGGYPIDCGFDMKRGLHERGGWVSHVLFVMSLLSLGMGLFLLGWAVWPVPTDGVQIPISKGILPGAPSGTDYASLADYTLNLSWPRWLRVGDEGEITLTLTSTEQIDDSEEGEVQIVVGEPVRIGLTLTPPAATQASLAPGSDMLMTWKIFSDQSGEYPGKVIVSFGFYDELSNELALVPVVVVDTFIIISALWGMRTGLTMWLGLVGVMLWGVFFLLGRVAQAKGK